MERPSSYLEALKKPVPVLPKVSEPVSLLPSQKMEKKSVAVQIPREFMERTMPGDEYHYMNLMFNMMGGLTPDDLSRDEADLLERRHGKNWETVLGYPPRKKQSKRKTNPIEGKWQVVTKS